MAYVAPADAEPGTIVEVEIRDPAGPGPVVPLPFYARHLGRWRSAAASDRPGTW